ncbi:GL14317 [Drosophila persimilis]|uniref:GL14317 n=1 Tax=Drosophila persimilis TaxID=7234 RepID=B4GTC1_DROPE|nr:GL14317 [Drosophila persimilis]
MFGADGSYRPGGSERQPLALGHVIGRKLNLRIETSDADSDDDADDIGVRVSVSVRSSGSILEINGNLIAAKVTPNCQLICR